MAAATASPDIQPTLDFPTESELDLRFRTFDAANPAIYAAFKKRAERLLNRGFQHYGAKSIMEAVRYHMDVSGKGQGEPWKVNNNYTSRYARKLAAEDSRFADFFSFRELRS